jgi:hypothetical protein
LAAISWMGLMVAAWAISMSDFNASSWLATFPRVQ